MILRRLRTSLGSHNWFAVSVDVVVVIVSILVAFQIDRWGEQRHDEKQESGYLLRLKEDLQMEVGRMDSALKYADNRIEAVKFLRQVLDDPSMPSESPLSLPWAVETAAWRSFPQITAFVYRELQATGNLSLIHSEALRRNLADHYQGLQHDSQTGMDLEAQHLFDQHTAGLLTIEELVAVEGAAWGGPPVITSPERFREIAEALKLKTGAIALMPSMVQHHVFNKKVIETARQRALSLIEQIDALTPQPD